MKLKLKTLFVAIAMTVTGVAQAAIFTDGYQGGAGAGQGTGAGELILTVYDPGRAQSLVLDLNLTANQFRFSNASLANTFNVTDSLLKSFIAGSSNQSAMRWNIGGISNMGPGPDLGLLSTNGNAGAFIDPTQRPATGSAILTGMGNYEFYANNNNALFTAANPNSAISSATANSGYFSGVWGPSIGGALRYDNTITGFTGTQLMSFIYADAADTINNAPFATAFANGQWKVDATLGKVSYVAAVPVPAAVWLLGSGLMGLIGISRRRKQAA